MNAQKLNNLRRKRRKTGIRKGVFGSPAKPRLSVYRSSKHIYAQLIDDESGRTLCASDSRRICGTYGGTVDHAKQVGTDLAGKAQDLSITKVRFDRGPYRFHGRVRALADAAREKGLEF